MYICIYAFEANLLLYQFMLICINNIAFPISFFMVVKVSSFINDEPRCDDWSHHISLPACEKEKEQ